MKYFGLDWIAMASSLGALGLLGNKNRYGFTLFMIANLCWIAIGHLAGSLAIVLGNIAFLGINASGFIRWSQGSPPLGMGTQPFSSYRHVSQFHFRRDSR